MVENPKIGDRYWCIEPTTEAKGYGVSGPCHPWEGVVTDVLDDGFCRFCAADDDGPDYDPNCSCWLYDSELYATAREAAAAFVDSALASASLIGSDARNVASEFGININADRL